MYMSCYRPLPAAVAMSLAVYFAQRNRGAFRGHFMTFSRRPQLVQIKGRDLYEQIRYCMSFNEVANTNIEAVFVDGIFGINFATAATNVASPD